MVKKVRCPRCGSDVVDEQTGGFYCKGRCFKRSMTISEQFNKIYFQYWPRSKSYCFTVSKFITISEEQAEVLRYAKGDFRIEGSI